MCRIQKKEGKVHTKLIRLFGNVTDQTEDARETIIVSWLSFVDLTIGNSSRSYV